MNVGVRSVFFMSRHVIPDVSKKRAYVVSEVSSFGYTMLRADVTDFLHVSKLSTLESSSSTYLSQKKFETRCYLDKYYLRIHRGVKPGLNEADYLDHILVLYLKSQ